MKHKYAFNLNGKGKKIAIREMIRRENSPFNTLKTTYKI